MSQAPSPAPPGPLWFAPTPRLTPSPSHPRWDPRRGWDVVMGRGMVLALLAAGWAACRSSDRFSSPHRPQRDRDPRPGITGKLPPGARPPPPGEVALTGGGIDLTLEGSTPTLTSPALPAGTIPSRCGESGGRRVVPLRPAAPMWPSGLPWCSHVARCWSRESIRSPTPPPQPVPLMAGAPVTLRGARARSLRRILTVGKLGPGPLPSPPPWTGVSPRRPSLPATFPTPGILVISGTGAGKSPSVAPRGLEQRAGPTQC